MKAAPEGATNVPKKLTKNAVSDNNPDWSPDGRRIVFEGSRATESNLGYRDVFRMRADGTNKFNLTHSAAIDQMPSWQPN